MTSHPNRSGLARALIAYLRDEYEAEYRRVWGKEMDGKTVHANTARHAEAHGYDPMQPNPGEYYSAEDHVEAIRIGNMTVAAAVDRARTAGMSAARNVAKDRLQGSYPPSVRQVLKLSDSYLSDQ